jgi:hypothetical protein
VQLEEKKALSAASLPAPKTHHEEDKLDSCEFSSPSSSTEEKIMKQRWPPRDEI